MLIVLIKCTTYEKIFFIVRYKLFNDLYQFDELHFKMASPILILIFSTSFGPNFVCLRILTIMRTICKIYVNYNDLNIS